MPLEAHAGIRLTHARSIIDHLYQRFACIIDDQPDLRSSGINGILQQFFYGAGRSLDNFAGGYLVGNIVW
jgi:hypothetical protein